MNVDVWTSDMQLSVSYINSILLYTCLYSKHCGYSATVANNFCLPVRQSSADLIQISQYLSPNSAEQLKQMQNNLIMRFKIRHILVINYQLCKQLQWYIQTLTVCVDVITRFYSCIYEVEWNSTKTLKCI